MTINNISIIADFIDNNTDTINYIITYTDTSKKYMEVPLNNYINKSISNEQLMSIYIADDLKIVPINNLNRYNHNNSTKLRSAGIVTKYKDFKHRDLITLFCTIDTDAADLFADTYYDRSGIFVPGVSTIPLDTYTDKTFEQIVDERALEFKDSNPILLWSGGIDSTTILAAFLKNNIPFEVTIEEIDAPQDLIDYVKSNCIITNTTQTYTNRTIITGCPCDQLYPSIQHSFNTDVLSFRRVVKYSTQDIEDYFKTEVPDTIKFIPAKEWFLAQYRNVINDNMAEANRLFDTYIIGNLDKFPVPMTYAYQMKWFIKFVIKYQWNLNNISKLKLGDNNSCIAFFNSEDFQRWALTNLDNNYNQYSLNYLTYKMPNKQYSYNVIPLDSVLSATKISSPWPYNFTR